MKRPIIVYGAGGLARETKWLIERINKQKAIWDFQGYVVTKLESLSEKDSKDEVIGDEAWLKKQTNCDIALGIGNPKARLAIFDRLRKHFSLDVFPTLIDPSAVFDPKTCQFEAGVIITAGVTITVNVKLKKMAFINLDCTIGHEAVIGEGCVLNPSVNISGGVTMGKGCLVGTGAQILQYATVGERTTIGAGAVVTKSLPSGITAVGIPAKITRSI